MGITRYAAPNGAFSPLCCHNYKDCAPTELMIPEFINARNRPVQP
jgi:hypothetical protein